MSAPSRERLERLSAATGFRSGVLEKVLRLLDILQEIANDDLLRDKLALKGGTALNVFHAKLERLSVDIDLNLVGATDRAEMLALRPDLEAALHRILLAQGYRVRRQPQAHAGGKWVLRHESAMGGENSLEIDVSYMMRIPLFGASRMDSVDLDGTVARDIFLVDLHEIVAGKLVALVDRRASRDLFDARRIFAMPELNWRWIRAAMLAIGAAGHGDWRLASAENIGVDRVELARKLAICLPNRALDAAGSADAWIAETSAICRAHVAALLELTERERTFLDGVADRGEIDASLLDVEPEIQVRIAQMPMLAWKADNVRRHRSRFARR